MPDVRFASQKCLTFCGPCCILNTVPHLCRCSLVVELQLPKLAVWVRFPSSAPRRRKLCIACGFFVPKGPFGTPALLQAPSRRPVAATAFFQMFLPKGQPFHFTQKNGFYSFSWRHPFRTPPLFYLKISKILTKARATTWYHLSTPHAHRKETVSWNSAFKLLHIICRLSSGR